MAKKKKGREKNKTKGRQNMIFQKSSHKNRTIIYLGAKIP
jgi:hypothetical protein